MEDPTDIRIQVRWTLIVVLRPGIHIHLLSMADTKLKSIPEGTYSGRRRPKTSNGRTDHRPGHTSDLTEDVESPTETTSSMQGLLARSRRIVIGAAEQTVIKGNMAKVVSGHPSVPLGRMLR